MLGRKNYSKAEIEQGKARSASRWRHTRSSSRRSAAPKADGAVESFEALFFSNMALVLDRYYVHRLPGADYEGKDGNPLNEVRIVCDSLLTNDGRLRPDKQIKLPPERSVLKLKRRRSSQAQRSRLRSVVGGVLHRAGKEIPAAKFLAKPSPRGSRERDSITSLA